MDDGRATLDAALANLSRLDPNWMVCGNAGGERLGRLAIRITDPHGKNQRVGALPAKVVSLDENFIVVRRRANLSLSHDLEGFHLYGTDLCLNADVLGGNCYVIDFHLCHKGAGITAESFFKVRERLIQKYRRAFRSRWIPTTCTNLFVSGTPLLGRLLSRPSTIRAARFAARSALWFNQTVLQAVRRLLCFNTGKDVFRQQYFVENTTSSFVWKPIADAPANCELELCIYENGQYRAIAFPCRRNGVAWYDVVANKIVPVRPTHWRPWHASANDRGSASAWGH
jgi:hypothetical protein